MDLLKYDMTDIWAVAGDVVAPDSAKVRAGWGVEVVPRQWWNWFENRQDQNIAYMLQKGFPEWDTTTEYIINKSYVQRNGIVYRATATSTNSDPIALLSWVKAFPESTPYLETLKTLPIVNNTQSYIDGSGVAQNVASSAFGRQIGNVADAAAARTLIAAQVAHANLTGLSSVSGDANNLPYFTGSGGMDVTVFTGFARTLLDDANAAAMRATLVLGNTATLNIGTTAGTVAAGDDSRIVNALQKGNNLSDLTNIITARSSLGLTSAAITSLTTSTTDSTAGRILRVADFGIGSTANPWYVGSLNNILATGSYGYGTGTTLIPSGAAFGEIIHLQGESASSATQMALEHNSARMWIRQKATGTWAGWVELYHTGNTQSIVDQVVADITPTLNAKVNKAGDAMTSTLTVPQIELGVSGGTSGFIDFHSSGSVADYHSRISVSGGTSTVNSGIMQYTAASHVFTGAITGTISTANSLTGNIPISQVTSLQATLDAKMPLTGAGTPNFTAVRFTGGMSVANNQGGYLLWNELGDGKTTFLNNQGGGSGGFVFRNVNTANTVETGRVVFNQNGSISCAVQCNVGAGVFASDGNAYGTIWGGWLSNWLATNVVYKSSLAQDSVSYFNVGSIGSYAFCYTNVAATPGQQVLGSSMLYGFDGGQGSGNPSGTWRCMGDTIAGSRTLFQRVA